MVEVQEERERLLHAILLALGVAVFGLLAGVAITGAIVVILWEVSRVSSAARSDQPLRGYGSLASPATYAVAARLAESSRHPQSTPKGPRMFGSKPHISSLALRKQLLVAESELNRTRLSRNGWLQRTKFAKLPTGPKPSLDGPRPPSC